MADTKVNQTSYQINQTKCLLSNCPKIVYINVNHSNLLPTWLRCSFNEWFISTACGELRPSIQFQGPLLLTEIS